MDIKHHLTLLSAIALLWAGMIYFWPNPGFLLLVSVPLFIPIYIGHRASRIAVIPSFPNNLKFVTIAFVYNCLFTLTPVIAGHLINDAQRFPQTDQVWQRIMFVSGLSFATAFIALFPPSVEKRNRACSG